MSQLEERTDGRVERSTATRKNILDATRTLMVNGNSRPTAREIAASAGITARTLFRHFSDVESLFDVLVQEAQLSIAAVMDEPFPSDQNDLHWRDLLARIIERRVRVYEHLLPLYVSSAWLRSDGSAGERAQQYVIRRRRRLKQMLPRAIATDDLLYEALDATLSIEFWLSLRRGQGLEVQRAAMVLRCAVNQLTASYTEGRAVSRQ